MASSYCPTGKQPFASRAELKAWLKRNEYDYRVYRCPECDLFHSTSANHRVAAWYRERRT